MEGSQRSIGDRVTTPDGPGKVVAIESHTDCRTPFTRYGVRHDVFPVLRPRVFKDDVLFYMEKEVGDETNGGAKADI